MRNKVNIYSTGFPDQLASNAEKDSTEFGLKVGQAIQYEWFRRDYGNCRFYTNWSEFHRLRLYARGEQSIRKYKDEIAVDGDLSYLNLDWTPIPVIPKFVDIVVNGMSDRLFNVKAVAQDALSQENRSKYQDMIQGQMLAKDVLTTIQDNTGLNPFVTNAEDLPSTDEELGLYMQLNYKPAIEIAEEEAVNTILEENHHLQLRKRVDYDLATLGIGIARHEFLYGSGVKISYVDPANVVYSYTEDPHFKDCFYWGEVKNVHLSEIYKINPDIRKDKMEEIQASGRDWYDYHNLEQFYDN